MHPPIPTPPPQSIEKFLAITHIIYTLHTFTAIGALLGSAFILTSFLFTPASLIAVFLNYWYRADVRGTWLDSHFSWQIRTFWYALLCLALILIFTITIVGIPVALLLLFCTGIWILYRMARGWLTLLERRMMPLPTA